MINILSDGVPCWSFYLFMHPSGVFGLSNSAVSTFTSGISLASSY